MQGKTLLHFLSEHTFRELGLSKDLLSQPHKAYWEMYVLVQHKMYHVKCIYSIFNNVSVQDTFSY